MTRVLGGGPSSNSLAATTAAATPVVTTAVTSESIGRFEQRADGSMHWFDGINSTAPRRSGLFHERVELYDFGGGNPFSQGKYNFLVVGNPADPDGSDAETATTGSSAEHGYNLHVHGFVQVDNSMSVFSRYQPYIVVGRLGIDNRFPTERPTGYGEEVALGIARSTTDYFSDIQVGDAALRAYGAGAGVVSAQRFRRILIGSNDGGSASTGHSTLSVGADDVQFWRPINLTGPAMTAAGAALPATPDGYAYIKVAGVRVKVPYYAEPVQVSDTFTRSNQGGLVAAETGQTYFIIAGGWLVNTNKGGPSSLGGSGFAAAVIATAADQTISASVTPGTTHTAWLCLRVSDGSGTNMLIPTVNSSTGTASLQKKVAGVYTTLASAAATWPLDSTHTLLCSIVGNNVTIKVDGATVVTHTLAGGDVATFAGHTSSGMVAFDTTTRFDNLTISNP